MARRGRPPKVPNAETVVPEEEKVEPEVKTQEEEPTNGQQDTKVTAAPDLVVVQLGNSSPSI